MTSHPSLGLSRPQPRPPGRLPAQAQFASNGPRAAKHVLIDLTEGDGEIDDEAIPQKRRKTGHVGGPVPAVPAPPPFPKVAAAISARKLSAPQPVQARPQKRRESRSVVEGVRTETAGSLSRSFPSLPKPLGNLGPSNSHRSHEATTKVGVPAREQVQVKPYVLEPPSVAPNLERESTLDPLPADFMDGRDDTDCTIL